MEPQILYKKRAEEMKPKPGLHLTCNKQAATELTVIYRALAAGMLILERAGETSTSSVLMHEDHVSVQYGSSTVKVYTEQPSKDVLFTMEDLTDI